MLLLLTSLFFIFHFSYFLSFLFRLLGHGPSVGFSCFGGNHFPIVLLIEIGASPHSISIWAIDGYQPPLYLF